MSEIESFGVVVAEAMACKIPVILTGIEGFKDLVPNANHAFIVSSTTPQDIYDSMEDCYLQEEKRKLAVAKSYQLVKEKFDWLKNLNQMKEVYLEYLH